MSEPTETPAPRARLRLTNVRRAFAATPWAILPEKLDAILAVVETHAAGGTLPAVENTFAARRDAVRGRQGAVGVLPIYGVLTQRAGLMTDYSGGTATESLAAQFDALAADPNVGTIVLDIDSPGGSVAGIPELAAKIAAARDSKKIVAVANTLCASAAYWLASQAHEIVASPSAMVGSIGVYAVHTDTSAADAQAGVSHTVIRFGANKADGLAGPLSENGLAEMQAIVDEHGKAFVGAVAKGRGITPAQVRADYGDGSIFAAKGAKATGLVDRIASLDDVLGSLGATQRRRAAAAGSVSADAGDALQIAAAGGGNCTATATPTTVVDALSSPLADARTGALGASPTVHTTPAPQARSHPVSDQNTAAQSGAASSDTASAILAERKRVSDVLALANEYNVDAATAQQWAANGLTVEQAASEILKQKRTQSAAQPQIHVGAPREAQQPFPTVAHQLQAVVHAARNPAQTDVRLLHINAAAQGSSTGSSADAGFLIQSDLAPGIESKMWDQGQILSRVTDTQISGNSFRENVLDESSRANGSRNGGIQGFWLGEASSITASRPKLRQVETPLNKVGAVWYATEETIEDAPALQSEVDRLVPEELTFQVEDKIYNGTGAGVPQGILTSDALVTQAIEATQTLANSAQFYPINFSKMLSRLPARSVLSSAFLVNSEVMPSVMTMTLGAGSAAIPVWLPPNGLAGAPFGTILGRPVIPIEYAAAHGTPGDIMLADLSDYRVIRKGGVNRSASIHVQFLTDEQVFKWTYRVGGKPRTKSPVTPYKGSATLSPYVVLATRS
jgi:HK97 family phage major capsid protein